MITEKRIAFHTLGCKLNFTETSTMARNIEEHGYTNVNFKTPADVYVLNTCSVTNNADKEARKIVRQILKRTPNAVIAMTGCYAQLKPEEVSNIPGVNLVLGNEEKFKLWEYLDTLPGTGGCVTLCNDSEDLNEFLPSYSHGERTRVFLKVQDGCDYPCTYCTIPKARGASRSPSLETLMEVARDAAANDTREIVLTGVNIGDFSNERGETFLDLLKELDKLENIDRIRISSIEPNLLTDEIIDFTAQAQKFVPHFHIPLQSGSNTILKAMKRRYVRELYVDRVTKINSVFPHAAIGVDVIVGFPGETEEFFNETLEFLKELEITYLHVFSYSEREGTEAQKFENKVPVEKMKERSKILHLLSDKKRHIFHEKYKRSTRPVLVETWKDGLAAGHTDNYILVEFPSEKDLVNKVVPVYLSDAGTRKMTGKFSR